MSVQALEASPTVADAPATAKAAGPFSAFKIQVLLSFFLQRIGLNQTIGGVFYPIPLSLFAMPAVVGWLLVSGWAKPSPTRIGLWCALVVGGCISMFLTRYEASAFSLYTYFALYAMFLFPVVLEDAAYERFFRMIANVGAALCIIGALQYAIQYVWSPPWLFTWRTIIPPEYLIEFNTLNWTGEWGSGLYKANGFFLMEASWLSQLGARTLLIAVIMLRDPRYLLLCVPGLIASYSGTGLLLFALFGIIPTILLVSRSRGMLMWIIVVASAVLAILSIFADALNLDVFTNRLAEFGRPDTSASFRFIVVWQAFERFLQESIPTLLFGAGPAAVEYYVQGLRTDGFVPGWLKLIVDYGFFGFVVFSAFLVTCVWQTTRSSIITAATLFQFLVLDGSLVVPQAALITFVSVAMVVRRSTFRPFGTPAPQAG